MKRVMTGTGLSVTNLEDRYEIGEVLGQGAIAIVYAARDRVLDIDVAVKVLREEHMGHLGVVACFEREAQIGIRMLSPHAAKVLDTAVSSDGALCIVFERLVGETLASRIARRGTLSLFETAEIVKQTARALGRAHALGIVHCDVKPDNIFLTEDMEGRTQIKLLDFGIAEMLAPEAKSPHLHLSGTPEYIAPEVLFGTQRADARADFYALGVAAFECLTGRCPFPGEDVREVALLVECGVRPSLLDLRPDLNVELDSWMERALQPDPYWRYASAREIVDELDRAVSAARQQHLALRAA